MTKRRPLRGLFIIGLLIVVGACWYLNRRPLVSVVMATYNREAFLPSAIESVLNQTMADFELIVINDGSQDKTADILRDYAAKDSRIRVITHPENKGLIASLNEGLDLAKGRYIARMDDDDVSFLWRFEHQIEFLERNPEIIGAGSWVSPPGKIEPYSFQRETNPERVKILLLLGENSVSHPALMIRNDFLKKNHIRYRAAYTAAEDRPFYADIMFAGGQLSNVPETLLHYRLHANNSYDYYAKQYENIFRFQKDYLEKYFKLSLTDRIDNCDLMPMLIKANQQVALLDENELEKINQERCADWGKTGLVFAHPHWTDTVFIDDEGQLKRKSTSDKAKVLEQTEDTITIKWDDWGTETFRKTMDNHYELVP